jgi:hypothetical protein
MVNCPWDSEGAGPTRITLSGQVLMTKRKNWRRWCLSCGLILAAGCGYFQSGTWEDDPANWQKAFRTAKPDDVVVVHSRYWRSPHWSYEAGYVFEIAANAALRQQLFTQNRLAQLDGSAATEAKRRCVPECPAWFAPKPLDEYEVWMYADEPKGNFRVLIDRKTGTIFLTDFQI